MPSSFMEQAILHHYYFSLIWLYLSISLLFLEQFLSNFARRSTDIFCANVCYFWRHWFQHKLFIITNLKESVTKYAKLWHQAKMLKNARQLNFAYNWAWHPQKLMKRCGRQKQTLVWVVDCFLSGTSVLGKAERAWQMTNDQDDQLSKARFWRRFSTKSELRQATRSIVNNISTDWYRGVFDSWVDRHRKCVRADGRYFEKEWALNEMDTGFCLALFQTQSHLLDVIL